MALGIVAASALSATPPIATATLLALAVLLARAVWATAKALRQRLRAARPRPLPGERRRAPSVPQRAGRVATIAALLTLAIASISLASALGSRGNSSLGIRAVEWMRDNGARGVVTDVENAYYSLTAPAKGGPALSRLPTAGFAAAGAPPAGRHAHAIGYRPPSVAPVIRPALPGEGIWRTTERRFRHSAAPLLVTTYRPDRDYPRVVAGLAWIDPRRASVALRPGLLEPAGGGTRSAEVPPAQRGRLLATFNSGFKHSDSNGGFYAGGRLFQPLVRGAGTIVGTSNGRVDIRTWTGGARPGPNVTFARQNLPLIVDHGRPNPNLSDGPEWGATLGNSVLVWRSAIGVDRRGDLIYAAASDQSVKGIASILIHAGAVRAIELDINSYWISFNSYAGPGARKPRTLLPGITRPATRYLSPDDRDFFAVYGR